MSSYDYSGSSLTSFSAHPLSSSTLLASNPEKEIHACIFPAYFEESVHSFMGDHYLYAVSPILGRLPAQLEFPGPTSSTSFDVLFSQQAVGAYVGQVRLIFAGFGLR